MNLDFISLNVFVSVDITSKDIGNCPVPCVIGSHTETVTYAGVAHYDVIQRMSAGTIEDIKTKFLAATEIKHRLLPQFAEKVKTTFLELSKKINKLEDSLENLNVNLVKTVDSLRQGISNINGRIKFHLTALGLIKDNIEMSFVSGWIGIEQSIFHYVTGPYYEIADTFTRTMVTLASAEQNSSAYSHACETWKYLTHSLAHKHNITVLAINKLALAYSAYYNGDKLIDYDVTLNGHYDANLINVWLTRGISMPQQSYNELLLSLKKHSQSMETMLSIGNDAYNGIHSNNTYFDDVIKGFSSNAEAVRVNIKTIRENVFMKPTFRINAMINEFTAIQNDFISDQHSVYLCLNKLIAIIKQTMKGVVNHLKLCIDYGLAYTNDTSLHKEDLARFWTNTKNVLSPTATLVQATLLMHTSGLTCQSSMGTIQGAGLTALTYIYSEYCLTDFYAQIYNDFKNYSTLPMGNERDYYVTLFSSLLNLDEDTVHTLPLIDLEHKLNADMYKDSLSSVLVASQKAFEMFLNDTDVSQYLGDQDHIISTMVTETVNALSTFEDTLHMDPDFYK